MKVSKWGNSLAVRLPAELVKRLGVKEGDELQATPGFAEESVSIRRKRTRKEMMQRLEEIRAKVQIPAGYKFKRADAYDDDKF